jgi:hypothetical protein
MRSFAFALWLIGPVACSAPGQDHVSRVSSQADTWSAIGAMQTRDYKVTWLAGQKLRIENAHGAVVADGVTMGDLERINPFLHSVCANGTAARSIDARFDPGQLAPMSAGDGR